MRRGTCKENTARVACEDASSRSESGRARDDQASKDVEDASSSSSASSAGASRAIREASPEPLQEVADWELEERIAIMFVVGAPAPVASERGALLPKATKQVVQRGVDLIRALCKAHGSQLSQSFGNFDQLVGLGWLLGDVVLGCFVSRADALAIGRRAGKLAPDFKKEFVAPPAPEQARRSSRARRSRHKLSRLPRRKQRLFGWRRSSCRSPPFVLHERRWRR